VYALHACKHRKHNNTGCYPFCFSCRRAIKVSIAEELSTTIGKKREVKMAIAPSSSILRFTTLLEVWNISGSQPSDVDGYQLDVLLERLEEQQSLPFPHKDQSLSIDDLEKLFDIVVKKTSSSFFNTESEEHLKLCRISMLVAILLREMRFTRDMDLLFSQFGCGVSNSEKVTVWIMCLCSEGLMAKLLLPFKHNDKVIEHWLQRLSLALDEIGEAGNQPSEDHISLLSSLMTTMDNILKLLPCGDNSYSPPRHLIDKGFAVIDQILSTIQQIIEFKDKSNETIDGTDSVTIRQSELTKQLKGSLKPVIVYSAMLLKRNASAHYAADVINICSVLGSMCELLRAPQNTLIFVQEEDSEGTFTYLEDALAAVLTSIESALMSKSAEPAM
jgi:hypothetical protein